VCTSPTLLGYHQQHLDQVELGDHTAQETTLTEHPVTLWPAVCGVLQQHLVYSAAVMACKQTSTHKAFFEH
jgi:hypothetical protein